MRAFRGWRRQEKKQAAGSGCRPLGSPSSDDRD